MDDLTKGGDASFSVAQGDFNGPHGHDSSIGRYYCKRREKKGTDICFFELKGATGNKEDLF